MITSRCWLNQNDCVLFSICACHVWIVIEKLVKKPREIFLWWGRGGTKMATVYRFSESREVRHCFCFDCTDMVARKWWRKSCEHCGFELRKCVDLIRSSRFRKNKYVLAKNRLRYSRERALLGMRITYNRVLTCRPDLEKCWEMSVYICRLFTSKDRRQYSRERARSTAIHSQHIWSPATVWTESVNLITILSDVSVGACHIEPYTKAG